jgi:hypothetical protein
MKIYPDIVMNHFGNGPDYRTYPGTRPQDFHGWNDGGQPGGYKRAPRMSNYGEINNGYGRTFQEELVSLIDLQTERDNRFSTGNRRTTPRRPRSSASPAARILSLRLRCQRNDGRVPEPLDHLAGQRDGFRRRAPGRAQAHGRRLLRHCPATPNGFLHNIQYNFDQRRGFTDYTNNATSFETLYQNYVDRDDALIFSEFFIGSSERNQLLATSAPTTSSATSTSPANPR